MQGVERVGREEQKNRGRREDSISRIRYGRWATVGSALNVPGLFGQRKRPRVRHVVPSPAPSAPSFALLFPPVSSPFLPCGHGPGPGAGDPVLQQMWQLHVRPPPQRPGGRLPQCQDKTGADAPQRSSPLAPRPARQDFALLGPWSSRARRLGGSVQGRASAPLM